MFLPLPPSPFPAVSLHNMSSPEGVNVAAMKNTDIQRNEVDVATEHGEILILQFVSDFRTTEVPPAYTGDVRFG
jgi:hypothetical protein